ncbi:GT4 family glycosyltransferase PelF [Moritella sp.]|uniref:GT4 family glycosyltransferase PelF n=1 Tax=Moritella sp. TaxID=78556 RepID=UPI001D7F5E45|nr:GT4 family glycosyltransferase PelF [Moritella sp.]MCJ8351049.1 GT4 family glycosyltransferase PelF [Moritella sp.]NQZ41127.1 GT4 family glycosyltransferase PelF [Moritella sp.]
MTKEVDICLLLEGTYPYVRGGVSTWMHQIIKGLPEFSFHIIFLGSSPELYDEPAYELPDNVVGFEIHYLLAADDKVMPTPTAGSPNLFQSWQYFLSFFDQRGEPIPSELLSNIADFIGQKNRLTLTDFLNSRASWEVLTNHYFQQDANQSFVDYFWTYRNIYQPLFVLASISQSLPNARVYHSVSTGYAGFLGALCRQKSNRPFLLTEHGIYTKERKIDLSQASWIKDKHNLIDVSMHKDMDATRQTWIRFFEQLGVSAYHQADRIVALFEGNRQRQHEDGADNDKTQVIANGIDVERFTKAYVRRPSSPPMVVGLVGRVVPIKDIKTFIRTICGVAKKIPTIEGWIIGPAEENKAYAHECQLLIESLGLEGKVKMLGSKDVAEIMPELGIMMLTSISEAQPLVLLEAMASGIPCIATEVGACREILDGAAGEDASLGSCGAIIPIANPSEGTNAIVNLLSDAGIWRKTGDIGKIRVAKYYDQTLMYDLYRRLYRGAVDGGYRL